MNGKLSLVGKHVFFSLLRKTIEETLELKKLPMSSSLKISGMENSKTNSWNSQNRDFWKLWSVIVSWTSILEQNVFRLISVELFKLNTEISTGHLEVLKMRFAKIIQVLWSTTDLWILILEWNVFGLIFRNIWEESRTVNRTLGTLRNEFSFEKY